jgi:hypothetical protein
MKVSRRITYLVALLTLIASAEFASAKPNPKKQVPTEPFTYSVIHAIPSGFGADVVDVYLDSTLVLDNATPGSVKTLMTTKANVTIRVFANGVVPSPT